MLLRRFNGNLLEFCSSHLNRALSSQSPTKKLSNDEENKNILFDQEIRQQMSKRIPRIEKIEVNYEGRGIADNAVMFMNKHMSTPFHCAMHISHGLAQSSVLALVKPRNKGKSLEAAGVETKDLIQLQGETLENDPVVWSMHHPLEEDCTLQILRFNMLQSTAWHHEEVNKAYWRSCAFLLGAISQEAFHNSLSPQIFNYPNVSINGGAFCCDVILRENIEWNTNEESLTYLTKLVRSIISQNKKFEPLRVEAEFAKELFSNDHHKILRIDNLLKTTQSSKISLYRLGNYIDIVDGPLIANTSLIFHFVVTAMHKLQNKNVWRIQGLSLPKDLKVHHAVWSLLEKRARKLVTEDISCNEKETTCNEKTNFLTYQSIENKTKVYSKATGQWVNNKWSKVTPESTI